MMAVLLAKLGKAGAVLIGAAALFAIAAFLIWLAVSSVTDHVASSVATARVERDAFWRGQIAEAQRLAAEQMLDQARRSQAIEQQARDASDDIQARLTEVEKENAALLATGACGIDHDRIRLLNR